ncbi:MAG: amidohydrolase [Thermoproteota archaeon]|nr:MAG: amidohydrolase [Candidatus Korarchaeota archaeon]
MCDILIKNAYVITMGSDDRVLRDGAIAIEGNRILDVGSSKEIMTSYDAKEEIDARDMIAIPGLINAHTHIAMCIISRIGRELKDRLYRIYWPMEKAWIPEDCYKAALMGAAEALLFGTTCVVDHYFFMEEIAKATTELGIRGVLGHTIMTEDGPWVGKSEFEEGVNFVKRWKEKHPLVFPCLAPHAPDTVSPDWLEELRKIANEQNVKIHMHLSQSMREVRKVRGPWGRGARSPVDLLHRLKVLGPDLIAVHCIHIDEQDMKLLSQTGTNVVYCPSTYALGGSYANAAKMIESGIRVLIGTDARPADMIGEMRAAAMTQRQLTGNPSAMGFKDLLKMATIDAAEALGLGDKLGSIEKGKLADLILISMKRPHMNPRFDPCANVIYNALGSDVDTVIVDGKIVVKRGSLTKLDVESVVSLGREAARDLVRRATEIDPSLKQLVN